jgi:hypothetical protein
MELFADSAGSKMPRDAVDKGCCSSGAVRCQAKTRFVDAPATKTRPLRAAEMLAASYEMERLIARDRAEMPPRLRRLRISQIMNPTWPAPDIQEAVLLANVTDGRDWVTAKKRLRSARCPSWPEQRRQFAARRACVR